MPRNPTIGVFRAGLGSDYAVEYAVKSDAFIFRLK